VAIVERDSLTTHVDGAWEDRAKSVASNFNNHFFSSKLLICFGFRCAVNPMTLWLRRSTKDAFRLFVSGRNQVLTGQHRMRLTLDPDRGTNTKITFAIVLDHSSKVINGRQPIGLLNDMVREVQRILMGTEPESRRQGTPHSSYVSKSDCMGRGNVNRAVSVLLLSESEVGVRSCSRFVRSAICRLCSPV
jgi:hypothetical protein